MGLFRFLAIFFLIYLVYSLVSSLLRSGRRRGTSQHDTIKEEQVKKRQKIIPKDEGEYVDFEEVD